jgi:hypothetical protein
MQTRSAVVAALVACALALPLPAWATDAPDALPPQPAASDLPPAEELFESYVAAIGGQENLAKHRNRVLHGVYKVTASGDTQVLTLFVDSQNRFRAELEAPGIGTTVRSTNGTDAWGTNISGTPFRLGEQEALELNDSAVFLGEAAYKDRYEKMTTVATAVFDNKPTYQVDFVTKSGLSGSVYFDAESKLLVGRQLKPLSGEGDGTLVLVRGYKEFDGVLLPTVQQQRFGNVQTAAVEIEFRWVEVNVEEMPGFDPPAQLAAAAPAGG